MEQGQEGHEEGSAEEDHQEEGDRDRDRSLSEYTSSNNGSYIYNGSGWSKLALYNTIGMLSNLSDVTLSSLSVT